ncbi:choice-of-anchor I family protein [Gracilibacillus dipsosauri]|uniref:Uncharacterized protein n=1 Tax=Gracilibacillus dipsosauri TaxID=178340 RepID=A0A317L4I1_9BACI|nr:choice-of-anchor I family protein [Gracilibacillus dipsosauri]PWU70174.1 hypothetical protein DLJ74_01545 [Gracilibacillus dipsosauri]
MLKFFRALIVSCLFFTIFTFKPLMINAAENELSYYSDKEQSLAVNFIGRYNSGAPIDDGGTEIVAYDPTTKHAFSVNGSEKSLDIMDLSVLGEGKKEIPLLKRITLSDLGIEAGDVTSVVNDPAGRFIAISVPAVNKVNPGHVVFLTTSGDVLTTVEVGALPDMVTITPDGKKVLVANEGEPSDDYSVNPEGSVSIIDVSGGVKKGVELKVTTARFSDQIVEEDVRKVHPESTYAEDLEPEYIVVEPTSDYAYIVLQEANAMAKLNLITGKFTTVKSLGYKDYSISSNQLDGSDKDDQVNIRNWPVLSLYQPDGMDLIEINGKSYILTANEGDAQDWDAFSEEARVKDLQDKYELRGDLYQGYTQKELDSLVENGLFEEEQLGRLKTSISHPMNETGKYEAIYGFGGRSFSLWSADTLELVYDSGSEFERYIAEFNPTYFHSNNDDDSFESRSDDKGVEPESVITGRVNGTDYAFIGLERQGGIMVYDLTNPNAPTFDSYFTTRNFQSLDMEVTRDSGDIAPEGLTFIPGEKSPTGNPVLLVAHEVSGTIAAYELGKSSDASLEDLKLDNGKLTPSFSPDVKKYEVEVAETIEELTLSPIAHSSSATVTINGEKDLTKVQKLAPGDNFFQIEVTAEDGTKELYELHVTRLASFITTDLVSEKDGFFLQEEATNNLADNGVLELHVPVEKDQTKVVFSPEQLKRLKDRNSQVHIIKPDVRLKFDLKSFQTDKSLTLYMNKVKASELEKAEQAETNVYEVIFEQEGQAVTSLFQLSFLLEDPDQDHQIYHWDQNSSSWKEMGGVIDQSWLTVDSTRLAKFAVFLPENLMESTNQVAQEKKEEPIVKNEENKTDKVTSEEHYLPNTATFTYNWLLIGGLILVIGISLVILTAARRKRIEQEK